MQRMAHDAGTEYHFDGMFAHQHIVTADIGLALGTVEDKGVYLGARAGI